MEKLPIPNLDPSITKEARRAFVEKDDTIIDVLAYDAFHVTAEERRLLDGWRSSAELMEQVSTTDSLDDDDDD